MDRKEYLDICRKAAMIRGGSKRKPLAKNLLVKVDGIEYEPISYELGFTETGAARHTAIVLDKNGNCTVRCRLEVVERVTT